MTDPRSGTCTARPSPTSPSAPASTSASACTWLGSRCASPSTACSTVCPTCASIRTRPHPASAGSPSARPIPCRCCSTPPNLLIMGEGRVVAIYVTPEAEGTPLAVTEVEAVAGKGLLGDRYFLGTGSFSDMPGTGRELTLIESEVVDDFD